MSSHHDFGSFSVGGSTVCVAAREVDVEERVERAFAGCRSPLARAALAASRGEDPPSATAARSVHLTARWVEENYARVYPALVSHLSSKMPLSRGLAVIEDHVQTFLARTVERDVLAPFLRNGKTVKLSVLRVWAYQSASTELRRWGADASLRTTRGAKTAREVLAGNKWRVVQHASTFREIVKNREDTFSVPELHDPNTLSPEETVARKSRVDLVRRHLDRIGKPHLVAAVDHLLGGGSLSDLDNGIAEQISQVLRGIRS